MLKSGSFIDGIDKKARMGTKEEIYYILKLGRLFTSTVHSLMNSDYVNSDFVFYDCSQASE